MTEFPITLSGVPIQRRIWGVNAMPITVRAAPAARPRATVVCTVRRSESSSTEPKCRATKTPAPKLTPLTKPVSRKIRLPEEPTAASASSPIKFPTIRESTALYICWNRLLKKMGMANRSIDVATERVVNPRTF